MRDLLNSVQAAAGTRSPILLEGESGTGKGVLARHIHQLRGERGDFVSIRCGENRWRDSLCEKMAPGSRVGTLYFRHIHQLEPDSQASLLNLLQASGNKVIREAAVMASTTEPLEPRVGHNEFLRELYFVLSAHRLRIPPLREHSTDVPELFEHLLRAVKPSPREELPAAVCHALAMHGWPGNGSELAEVARAYALAPGIGTVQAELALRSEARGEPLDGRPLPVTGKPLPVTGKPLPVTGKPLPLKEHIRQAVSQMEADIIRRTLEEHKWNRRRAARTLQISYRALLYKIKAFGLGEDVCGG